MDAKKVIGCNLANGAQVRFESIGAAAVYLKLDVSHIRKCLNGTRDSHGGYSWAADNTPDHSESSTESQPSSGWSAKEDLVLMMKYPTGRLSDIVSITKRDIVAITVRAFELGLKRGRILPKNRSELDLVNFVVSSENLES